MKILVCVKHVPDMESAFRPNEKGDGFAEEGLVFRANTYDEVALEEAAQMKKAIGDVEVTALTVGPARAGAAARRGIEFGADNAVHVLADHDQRLNAEETASLIAAYADGKNFDLLLFGIMSEDEQRCATGPMTAAILHIPCVTAVISEKLAGDLGSIRVERELEAGRREVVELRLPACLTVQTGLNIPRYPNLTNKLRAKSFDVEVIAAEKLVQTLQDVSKSRVYPPPPVEPGAFIEGSVEEQARRVARLIRDKAGVF